MSKMSPSSLNASFLITVELWIIEGQRENFDVFENQAVKIMREYGGCLIVAHKIQNSTSEAAPYEIHVLKFPDEDAFNLYREDDKLRALSDLRKKCIKRTEVHFGYPNSKLEQT